MRWRDELAWQHGSLDPSRPILRTLTVIQFPDGRQRQLRTAATLENVTGLDEVLRTLRSAIVYEMADEQLTREERTSITPFEEDR